jgi:uncharacterized protein with von Willebrand factor type A (vWA) domain
MRTKFSADETTNRRGAYREDPAQNSAIRHVIRHHDKLLCNVDLVQRREKNYSSSQSTVLLLDYSVGITVYGNGGVALN